MRPFPILLDLATLELSNAHCELSCAREAFERNETGCAKRLAKAKAARESAAKHLKSLIDRMMVD